MQQIQKFILIIIFMSFGSSIPTPVWAQQDAQYTLFMFNGLTLNPAYAGSRDRFSITGLFRKQWVGIEGAPTTQTLSMHTPIFGQKMGVGLMLTNDRVGDSKIFTLKGSYAYRLKVGQSFLALGLHAGFTQYRADYLDVRYALNPNFQDVAFNQNLNETLFNIGTGIYYHNERFYASFSVPQMINNNLTGGISDARQSVHYFLSTGYVFNMKGSIKIKPAIFAKFVSGSPISLDFNANVNIKDFLEVGVSYRWDDSIDFLLILPMGRNLAFGYAYDATLTELNKYNSGSHEIMLRYEFNVLGKSEKILTPRYF